MTTPRTQSATTRTTTKTTTKTPSKNSQDAIALLKADHRHVEELFAEYEGSKQADKRSQLVDTICNELTIHAELEESKFYPAIKDALGDDADLVDEAQVEHASLKWLIHQLQTEAPDSDLHAAKVTVLKEYVSHHVKEEEKQLFPKVKKSGIDTVALGATLESAKTVLKNKLKN